MSTVCARVFTLSLGLSLVRSLSLSLSFAALSRHTQNPGSHDLVGGHSIHICIYLYIYIYIYV